jgi:hypothetical protein
MVPSSPKKKNPAAVALGRTGGRKGGPARAAKLTAKQRRESARKAVQARWAKTKGRKGIEPKAARLQPEDASDKAVRKLLKLIRLTDDPREIRRLSDLLERAIFHKQYANA